MMRFRPFSVIRKYLLPSVAAIFIVIGSAACTTSGDGEPNPAIEGGASAENAVNNTNIEAAGAENGAVENQGGANAAGAADGNSANAANPIGNELNNAIANDKDGAATAENGGAINAEADAATPPAGETPETSAAAVGQPPEATADANTGNPFATASTPAPLNATNASAAPVDPGVANATAPSASPATDASYQGSVSESSAPAGPTALPEAGSKMAYYVMRGDTLGDIAQKIYGSRQKWKELRSANGLVDANKIYPGDVIYFTLNESSKAFAEKYEFSNRQSYKVEKGDTLSQLAAKFFGTQGAWRTLWKENPQIKNPDRIQVGMVISFRSANKVALKEEPTRDGEDAAGQEEVKAVKVQTDKATLGSAGQTETVTNQFTAAAE